LEKYISHVSKAIQILISVNLTINCEKSKFGFSKLVYLDQMIFSDGVLLDMLKLVTLRVWLLSNTGIDLCSFHGLANG
jgi:hypothetical protein